MEKRTKFKTASEFMLLCCSKKSLGLKFLFSREMKTKFGTDRLSCLSKISFCVSFSIPLSLFSLFFPPIGHFDQEKKIFGAGYNCHIFGGFEPLRPTLASANWSSEQNSATEPRSRWLYWYWVTRLRYQQPIRFLRLSVTLLHKLLLDGFCRQDQRLDFFMFATYFDLT